MPRSNFKRLWKGCQPFKGLKMINLNYSENLKKTPDFGNSKLVERLGFRGCKSLRKLHPSIRDLSCLYSLDLEECTNLEALGEPIGLLNELVFMNLEALGEPIGLLNEWANSWVKRSPEPMKQWPSMSSLYLGHCRNLRRLPEQLGDMEGLKELDAGFTAIEELPDSITHLKGLLKLVLSNCKKLRKLPEDIGNMEGLRTFAANNTAIEHLPDSFVGLINLVDLNLSGCINLRNLPNEIWKLKLLKVLYVNQCPELERLPDELGMMQCLESLCASFTAIQQVPESIQLLSRLRVLDVSSCDKLRYVPNSVWNLTSLAELYLLQSSTGGRNNLPHTVNNTKLIGLSVSCDIRLWLPMIQSFSSLEQLFLRDEGESSSSAEPVSLSDLYNLQLLELFSFTGFGSLFPELPPNLKELRLCNHATLTYLPALSDLKQLMLFCIYTQEEGKKTVY